MKELLAKGYKPKLRPSGHDISDKFGVDNGAAIPPQPARDCAHGKQLPIHWALR